MNRLIVNDRQGKGVKAFLFLFAITSVIIVLFISFFIFYRGMPLFRKYSFLKFITSSSWDPMADEPSFGILSFIAGSFYVTLVSFFMAKPMGIGFSVYMAELSVRKTAVILRRLVELLAGIPSVIFGFIGVTVISRFVRYLFGGTGFTVLTGGIVLSLMILPTIITVAEVSIRSVPRELKEGSLALGATNLQTIFRVIIPAAGKGITAGIILSIGRSVGETMAVLMVAGNATVMPDSILSMTRTMTMNIVTDMGYAEGDHMTSLFSTAIVLFVFILIINLSVNYFTHRVGNEKK